MHGSKKEVSWGTGNHLGAKYWSLRLLNTISLVRSLFDHVTIPSAAFLDEEDGKTAPAFIILVTLFVVSWRGIVLNCTYFTMVYPWSCTDG